MAQRIRNHVIEDKSRQALSAILPDNWVMRDKDKDYGIDCEVEIFDNLGNPTGLVFWVQLKGTESISNYHIMNVAFPSEKIYQFCNYIIPVLIVRYSLKENVLYYIWANDKSSQKNNGERIITQFSKSRTLDPENITSIESYLVRFHRVKNGRFALPITVFISKNILEESNVKLSTVSFFKNIIQKNGKYLKLVRNEHESDMQIIVGDQKTHFSLAGTIFSSIGYDSKNLDTENFSYYNDAFLACISILLYISNKTNLADQIFFENSLLDIVKLKEDFLISFLPHLLWGPNYEKVLNELIEIFEAENDNSVQNFSLIFLMVARKLNLERQNAVENFILKQMEYSKTKNYTLGIAISNYNLGNFHRSKGNFVQSLHYYRQAKKYNPEYYNKSYFHFEVAGILFELKKYLCAAKFYKKSIDLGTDYILAKALLGDTLLYSGQYEVSLKWLDDFLTEHATEDEVDKDEWYLKYFCINLLLLNGYAHIQKRDINEALNYVKLDQIKEAIESDLLCADAWFQNGLKRNEDSEHFESYISFVMSALFNKNDLESWTYATILGFVTYDDQYNHLIEVVKVAYYYNGEDYIDYLNAYVSCNYNGIHEPLITFVESLIRDVKKDELKIRFLKDEVNYETLTLKDSQY